MNRDEYIFKRIREHYEDIKDKYEVVGIFLQGSQNYGLDVYDDDYKSDIDTKAIILPTFEDIVYNSSQICLITEHFAIGAIFPGNTFWKALLCCISFARAPE